MAEAAGVSCRNYMIKSKNAYLRMKNCSPKFKTVLRQRYKERVENSRSELLARFRHSSYEEGIATKSDAPHWSHLESEFPKTNALQDVFGYNKDFNLDEELLLEDCLKEELTQFENWLLQEYESLWDEEENDEIVITCPLCCCGCFKILDSLKNTIYCTKCYLTFTTQRSMLEVQNGIFSEVDNHNLNCNSDPAFVQVPGDGIHNNLCIVCDICAYLQLLRTLLLYKNTLGEWL